MARATNENNRIELLQYVEKIMDEREKQTNIRFLAQEEALKLRFLAQEEVLKLSKEILNKDLVHLNNLREEVSKDRNLLLPIKEHGLFRDSLDLWKDIVSKSITQIETRYESRIRFTTFLAIVALIAAILDIVLKFVH